MHYSTYDRQTCLITAELVQFVEETQPKKWAKLKETYGAETEARFSRLVSDEVGRRGLIEVLRGDIKHRGLHFSLLYFEPKSGLNPRHHALFERNRFSLVRQLHYSSRSQNSLDVVLFVNGLPIATLELKNELSGQSVRDAERQYRLDRNPKGEPLLQFKRCLVHFCVDTDQVSMTTRLSGEDTQFLPFNKGIENPVNPLGPRTHYLWQEVLAPRSLLDIVENFVHVSTRRERVFDKTSGGFVDRIEEKLVFPRYHQLDVIRSIRTALIAEGVGTDFLIQHTTGSGKSYSIGWLAHMLTSLHRSERETGRLFDSVIVVTDRRVLDRQLQATIRQLERTGGVVYGVEKGSQQLKEYLEQGKPIVVSTIQKYPYISQSISALKGHRFAVIVDEVHSSQSGENRRHLNKALSTDVVDEDQDVGDLDGRILAEMKNRGRQSNVSFFGFTGTPKAKTLEIFGRKDSRGLPRAFHTYSMRQSIAEGFTLDVLRNYTTYKRHFELSKRLRDDPTFPQRTSSRELVGWVDLHEHSIREKVQIILDHFAHHTRKKIAGKGKAMVVVSSRLMCVRYKQEMDRQLLESGLPFKCLVGFSGAVQVDGIEYTEAGMNPDVSSIPEALKRPEYRVLIVANKFQTGFDEPLLHTMYVDKRLRGLQCVQTLSRLNRTSPSKNDTCVIDFVNESADILESFEPYFGETILEETTDPNRLYALQADIEGYRIFTARERDEFCRIFLDASTRDEQFLPIVDRVVDRWRDLPHQEERERFRSDCSSFVRLYGYVSQIADFFETDWEKLYVFLRAILKKLPRAQREGIDSLLQSVDLDFFRMEKQFEGSLSVSGPDPPLQSVSLGSSLSSEDEKDFLSAIVQRVNDAYGIDFEDEDRVTLEEFRLKVFQSPAIEQVHRGDNSPINKRKKFMDESNSVLLDFVNERLTFYKLLDGNPEMKRTLMGMMYEEYLSENGFRSS